MLVLNGHSEVCTTTAEAFHTGLQMIIQMWFRKSAEQGQDAQYNLGVMYDNGKGVPQDDKQSVMWFRKAAEQGHAYAQFSLGSMYHEGNGVPQDYKQAITWFRKAAEQGMLAPNTISGTCTTEAEAFHRTTNRLTLGPRRLRQMERKML